MQTNRLSREPSPYLRQHAGNPVDWYPWGEEAFAAARRQEKPVFLSIGYAACHWCHVMEAESFADLEVAALLNRDFICIKVDREERPDLDAVYMAATLALTGNGGWPMTVFLTPAGEPFLAGTYFPKCSAPGRGTGLLQLLPAVSQAWRDRHREVLDSAAELTRAIRTAVPPSSLPLPPESAVAAERQLAGSFDAEHGGFGHAPKFPTPQHLSFLMQRYTRTRDQHLLDMVETTLTHLRLGGVYDQIGFGFHRYATDRNWRVPHFEKMLYDQALLAIAYLEAFQLTGRDFYSQTAREIFTYVLRDLRDPDGAFCSSEDADSEGREGGFYLWTKTEIEELLGHAADDFAEACAFAPSGDFGDGQYLIRLHDRRDISRFETERRVLFQARTGRVRPMRDSKILTDWNGLMIAALARGGRVLDEPGYTLAAAQAADFILTRLRTHDGNLMKRYCRGEAGLPACLDDYAFLVWGLIELYQAEFAPERLEEAVRLTDVMLKHFAAPDGGLYLTADTSENLLFRPLDLDEGAMPSGNAVAAANLVRLASMTSRSAYVTAAAAIFRAAAPVLARYPAAFTGMLSAEDLAVEPMSQVVIAGDPGASDTRAMLSAIRRHYLPRQVLLLRPESHSSLARVAPFTAAMPPIKGTATAYVCRGFTCAPPSQNPAEVLRLLGVEPFSSPGASDVPHAATD